MNKRLTLLIVLLSMWAGVLLLKNFNLAVLRSEHYLKQGELIATYYGSIPAPRGRIVDADRVPLVWSEKYFDLYYLDDPANMPEELCTALSMIVRLNKRNPLVYSLKPDEIEKMAELLKGNSHLKIKMRVERIAIDSPKIRQQAGQLVTVNGETHGISGLELEHDAALAGQSGRFKVLLDRYRNWIANTYVELIAPQPGRDVVLNLKISDFK